MILLELLKKLSKFGFSISRELCDEEHGVYAYYLIDKEHQEISPHGRSPIYLAVDDGKVSVEDLVTKIKSLNIENETKHPNHIKWMNYVSKMQKQI